MSDVGSDEAGLRLKLSEAFILNSSLPLVTDANDSMAVLGTGTLFNINNRYFIVTAGHILKENEDDFSSPDIDLSTIAYPSRLQSNTASPLFPALPGTLRPAALATLGPLDIFRPKMPSAIDIAVIEIKSSSTIAALKSGWRFLTPRNVGILDNYKNFILAGYLFEGATFKGGVITQKAFSIHTDLLDYRPEVRFPDPSIDRFYYLPEILEAGDPPREITSLKGLSGASIWAYATSLDPSRLWDASVSLRVIGVQSSAKMGHWFRGVDWVVVKSILGQDEVGLGKSLL